ncbi:Fatty-acyl-CoA synthase [Balamuthia mandrillaris]
MWRGSLRASSLSRGGGRFLSPFSGRSTLSLSDATTKGFFSTAGAVAGAAEEEPQRHPPGFEHYLPVHEQLHLLPQRLRHPEEPHSLIPISHVKGSSEVPLISKPIGRFFDQQVSNYSSETVLRVVEQDVRWSWTEWKKRADSLAKGLHDLGFVKGDRIGVWMPNNSEWVVAQYAFAKLGIILVNINPAYRLHELKHALNLVGCKGIVVTPQFKTSDYIHMLNELVPELPKSKPGELKSKNVPSLKFVIQNSEQHIPGTLKWSDLLVEGGSSPSFQKKLADIEPTLHVDDAINIQFTSGTTGLPKGATLTHLNILNNGFFVGERMKLTPEDVMCIPVPLYHCFGLVLGNLAGLTHGSRLVYPSFGFDPLKTLQAVQDEKCTALHGVPTMFIAELQHPRFKEFDLSSLRTGIMAGSNCPIEVMKRVAEDMHMKEVTICYGMTETSPVSFQTETNAPRQKRVETVGRIHPHVECKIIDTEGRTLPIDSIGELCTRGYSVMKGYWNDPAKTKEAIDEFGWMHTGDLAVFDAEGYCRIVGRSKDMIIRGGENIYPREIEEFLYTHPSIADIQVIGVPDEKYGEEVCAWVKLKSGAKLTAEEIKEYCKEQIAHYKVPRYILFKDEFPLTITGKVLKYVMREQSIRELGLKAEAAAPKRS